ncbi:HTH-type transcriptional activator IlvY [Aliikangiella sp. IMCC44632]
MKIQDLSAFIQLAESLHFNQTANQIHMTPSTLSRLIQRLEEAVGAELFVRNKRQVQLSMAGRRYLEFANRVIEEWRLVKHDLSPSVQLMEGRLSLFCTVTAAHYYLAQVLQGFREDYPRVELGIETGDVALAKNGVLASKYDFAFAVNEDTPNNQLAFHHIDFIPFTFIAPKGLRLLNHDLNKEFIDWNRVPFVLPESGPSLKQLQSWFKKMQIKPKVYARVSGNEALVSMVALGCGIGAIPAPVLSHSPIADRVQKLAVEILPQPFDLGIIGLKSRLQEPVLKAFWQRLKY